MAILAIHYQSVRMKQDFTMRYPRTASNYGSMDGTHWRYSIHRARMTAA
ncbi:MAG: hypothetical protein KF682_11330 [Nitrospira sp.]|nr:hypothetical protein [Nitrospira sp.]